MIIETKDLAQPRVIVPYEVAERENFGGPRGYRVSGCIGCGLVWAGFDAPASGHHLCGACVLDRREGKELPPAGEAWLREFGPDAPPRTETKALVARRRRAPGTAVITAADLMTARSAFATDDGDAGEPDEDTASAVSPIRLGMSSQYAAAIGRDVSYRLGADGDLVPVTPCASCGASTPIPASAASAVRSGSKVALCSRCVGSARGAA